MNMWTNLINTFLGIWLMAAPAVLGYSGAAATNDRIIGPLAATVACVAIWQVMRACRWVNVVLGAWLVLAPWILNFPGDATVNSMAVGIVLSALSLVRGKQTLQFGGGWKVLWQRSSTWQTTAT